MAPAPDQLWAAMAPCEARLGAPHSRCCEWRVGPSHTSPGDQGGADQDPDAASALVPSVQGRVTAADLEPEAVTRLPLSPI